MNRFEPIERLVIVNRGEAALRCIRAVKALRALEGGHIEVVALYTDVDRDAPFVRHADRAFMLPAPQGEIAAYLDHELLLDAIRSVGADAVWPGWGFVSEDPSFVERLDAAGIRFLGPSAAAMRALGDKVEAKRLAERVGVPVTPWSGGVVGDEAAARRAAKTLGFPVLVKAAAGGGGRGIRIVESEAELDDAFRSAAAEAESAFGDGRVFLERVVQGGRHIEVQIAADVDGLALALGCRDCSVQRRHQKVLEEAPPPDLSAGIVEALQASAVRLAESVDYQGLGTAEFLVRGEEFHFLEMNPRLQVEHGITEEITGLDLVQLQIRIARGESLASVEFREHGVAIEARICAEDPQAGFLPAPGRIARFDPALGPGIRIDTGVVAGTPVPPAFDSLVAKVIAKGGTREEARSRLVSALVDFDLLIEGGATNKGWLTEILQHPDYRVGSVDTRWLDRVGPELGASPRDAAVALVTAAILTYQRTRESVRINFYADTTSIAPRRIPPSTGQEIDLLWSGESYRLRVFAMGAWRYRVHLDDRVVPVTLREEGEHSARLEIGERALRVLHDASDSDIRVEVSGRAYRFGSRGAGQVRAGSPAMVVAVNVQPGDRVRAGQPLGLLEAMKMEIGFEAPVAGVVSEVFARRGQQVVAGDVLLVIDSSQEAQETSQPASARVVLWEQPDPLEPLFRSHAGEILGAPDLSAADRARPELRRAAIEAGREEVRRVLLGYDANPDRTERLAHFLQAPLPEDLSESFCWELSEIRHELGLFADISSLFVRWASSTATGVREPSSHARLRMYVRRIRAGGAGIAEPFLEQVRAALHHYGIATLEPGDALERAVLRLLASPLSSELRDRLVLGTLRRVTALARAGVHLRDDRALSSALERIAVMRGLVSHSVADAAIEARYVIFERPGMEHQAERTSKELQIWLDAAEAEPTAPPERVLRHLADAPRPVFERIGRWLADPDPRRRAIALAAHVCRLYSPGLPRAHASSLEEGQWIERLELEGSRVVLAGACTPDQLESAASLLVRAAERERESHEWPAIHAIELFMPWEGDAPDFARVVSDALSGGLPCGRFTVNLVRGEVGDLHQTFVPTPDGFREDVSLAWIHPAAAERIDLLRLSEFELERLEGTDGIYSFAGHSRTVPGDERLFVLADLRNRSPEEGQEAWLHLPAFEHAFYEATRLMRTILGRRDPKRRLQWNRIAIHVATEIFLDPEAAGDIARRLAPATRNLGLEKVVVRLRLLDRDHPDRASEETEIVISDVSGANMAIQWREPRTARLSPRSEYERRVVEARRRRLVYPYEVVRMLTGSAGAGPGPTPFPTGSFEEYDLDPEAPEPRARSVSGRPYGENSCGIVFGVISTPTEKVPEGMGRVLLLSDPTFGMGSLAGPECDRIVAAIDLAEKRGLPVEWLPVSSGARIAMDSGTENLDATARVVRRIVEFTGSGGVIHAVVTGVNVGAQSYFDALATMLMHTRGVLIMTERGSMVLTGRAALEASGAVADEDEAAIGGFERIMGPNGEAQFYATDLIDAYRILYEHYRFTYVVPGESGPRTFETGDPPERSVLDHPTGMPAGELETVGDIFDDARNPGRKRPFPMRAVMEAVIDTDGGHLERWRAMVGAETAIVWDAHLGGRPVCLIGIESLNIPREGYRPLDGPAAWSGGTLFPLSSKKVARAINAASGNRPLVVLANLSGFDGSPDSMRRLQLEYGAEIARAVVDFDGPLLFLVVSRYHGGAYVVFSRALNPRLRAAALRGSFASVIGGGAAASVVFTREVRARATADPRVRILADRLRGRPDAEIRAELERTLDEVSLEKQSEIADEFDAVHTVERAREVGSLEGLAEPGEMRAFLIRLLKEEETRSPGRDPGSGLT